MNRVKQVVVSTNEQKCVDYHQAFRNINDPLVDLLAVLVLAAVN